MSRRTAPPITLPEYERLFRVIHAVLAADHSDPAKACLFFAVAGAYLLGRHHKLKSVSPVAGTAGYNLNTPTNLSIILGEVEDGKPVATLDHFHCWIEADGWIIDLCAPLFDMMAPADRKGATIAPKMFQKPVQRDLGLADLSTPGTFIHVPDERLSIALIKGFAGRPAYAEMVRSCEQWYVRPPKKIANRVAITTETGAVSEVSLSPIRVQGIW